MKILPEPRQYGEWPPPAFSGKLSITAFAGDLCPLARTNDHAEAVLTHSDTPDRPIQDPQNTQASAGQVKRQAETETVTVNLPHFLSLRSNALS